MQVTWIDFGIKGDERGYLVALEECRNIPFRIKRVYYIFDTKDSVRRGLHAHKQVRQVAVCLAGSCRLLLTDGRERAEVLLDTCHKGLVIDPMIWHEMFDFSRGCVLMVVASDYYDEADYIRSYDDFLRAAR